MEFKLLRLVATLLALTACAACTVPVPDPGSFGQSDKAADTNPADAPDLGTDIAADFDDDTNPDLSPDLSSDDADTTDITDTTETTEPDQTADQPDASPDISLPACTTATDCDDSNPCTDDTCNPETGCAHQTNTLVCTDGDACTTNTTCQDGACKGIAIACDDANPCTDDTCDKLEGCIYLPNSATCTDGNACTQADTCADSFCKGAPLACNDGNPCTDDLCDKALGCTTTPNASTCDDGNACTTGEACTDGACLGGGELGCDDGIPCTSDGCDPAAGCTHGPDATACNDSNPCTDDTCQVGKGCVYLAAGATCTDGNDCTTGEACAGGKCAGGNWTCACATDADCDDKNPCTTSTCQAGTCQTANAEDGTACDDGDACVSGDVCSGGACEGAVAVSCDDDNECTFDLCEPKLGCLYLPHTMACDDGDPCTVGEACAKKSCTGGTVKACGDGNACTDDSCIKGQGCANTPNTKPCEDGNACTVGDACKAGTCAGAVLSCDDGFACTTDTCNSGAGSDPCAYTAKNGLCDDKNVCTDDACLSGKGCVNAPNVAPCDDGNACTKSDACSAGSCKPGAYVCVCKVDGDCDDKNACTKDTCEGGLKCVNAAVTDGATCDDGTACTTGEACISGKCSGGKAVSCDDANPCTADSCDAASGCKHANTTVACNDNDACIVGEACAGGTCVGGVAKACDDSNVCTDDGCEPATGCVHTANAVECADGNACTIGDACAGAKCVSGPAAKCDDGNVCTDDSCKPLSGCVYLANSVTCTDGDACTTADACKDKACVGGVPPVCDDGNVCTDDSCDKTKGCVNAANTLKCDDSDACTTVDECAEKACVGSTAPDCDDGNVCTDDGCDTATGCVSLANAATCTDGDACTVGDACGETACVPGEAPKCDDGNACTDDACDKVAGCTNKANLAACEDGNACTMADICKAGSCVAGLPKLWTRTFGGSGEETSRAMVAHPGGFALAGHTDSAALPGGRKSAGGFDAWLANADVAGGLVWNQTYGGSGDDRARGLVALEDGFAFAGYTNSTDLPGGQKTSGGNDFWLVRTDGAGNLLWNKTYGGAADELGHALVSLADGYAIAGQSASTNLPGGQKTAGGADFWLARTDSAGNLLWNKTFGGSGTDTAFGLVALADGFALAGQTDSVNLPGGQKTAGLNDAWLVRTDTAGSILWSKTYGGSHYETAEALIALPDGFALAGRAFSSDLPGGQTTAGGWDFWLVRTDSAGNLLWNKTFGGAADDLAYAVVGLKDGFLLAGAASSMNLPAGQKTAGGYDFWLARTDMSGNLLWNRTLGGGADEWGFAVAALPDGFAVAGDAKSANLPGGQKSAGGADYWVVRSDPWGSATCAGSGSCVGKVAADCDDFKPCTADWCDAVLGCQHAALAENSPCGGAGFACTAAAACAPKGMVPVPAGEFQMGCVPGDSACEADQIPRHAVSLSGFYMDGLEVTVAKYKACVNAGKCGEPGTPDSKCNWGVSGKDQDPMNCVNWYQAKTYCESTGGRLPTEAEWEKAARGGVDGKLYPWGDVMDCGYAVQPSGIGPGCNGQTTAPVGSKPAGASAYGVYDMAGNVGEWTADWHAANWYANTSGPDPVGPAGGTAKVNRGGAFASPAVGLRASKRYAYDPLGANPYLGFRCARTASACDPQGCDDGNACTTDICDEKAGKCTHVSVDKGASCPIGGLCSAEAKCVSPPFGMVGIPTGTFKMGCVPGDSGCSPTEKPQHTVALDAFYIDVNEVAAGKYQVCVTAGKCPPPQATEDSCYGSSVRSNWDASAGKAKLGRESHPMNCIDWAGASAYCAWSDAAGHLPTEAQWEKAARGGLDGKLYPWGDAGPTCSPGQPNTAVWEAPPAWDACGSKSTWAVGTGSSKNAYGLFDTAGNVREWVADWYCASCYDNSPASNPTGPENGSRKVYRGGGFADTSANLRASMRGDDHPLETPALYTLGFRCARTFP